ncbi:hypothetical protein KQX54_006201 [Cotesia glomerata]|uniref:Uncharacterized protein n=1 Tax=Cotesia glomerata TaxID=32391 RepID=A0AAV7I7D9_COTGL|nr:hypothetical protein KQX54_006201 [Cotesia glomerata]
MGFPLGKTFCPFSYPGALETSIVLFIMILEFLRSQSPSNPGIEEACVLQFLRRACGNPHRRLCPLYLLLHAVFLLPVQRRINALRCLIVLDSPSENENRYKPIGRYRERRTCVLSTGYVDVSIALVSSDCKGLLELDVRTLFKIGFLKIGAVRGLELDRGGEN